MIDIRVIKKNFFFNQTTMLSSKAKKRGRGKKKFSSKKSVARTTTIAKERKKHSIKEHNVSTHSYRETKNELHVMRPETFRMASNFEHDSILKTLER